MSAADATPTGTTDRPDQPARRSEREAASLTLGEIVVGLAIVVVAVVAEVSLVLAHARVWTLVGTALGATALLGVVVLVALRSRARPVVRTDPAQLGVLGALVVAGGLLLFPGFPVAMAGWDPGVYVAHGLAIPRTGSFDVPDPALAAGADLPGTVNDERVRFPGLAASTLDEGRSIPGFYHLHAALLAPPGDVAGPGGVVNVNPVLGVLVALATCLVAWRAFGPVAGTLAGVVATVNMIGVWHARYPTSEVLTQLLLVGAVLGVVVAAQARWRPAAGLAGVLTGLVFVARADGMVMVGLAVVALSLLAIAGRFDRRATWYAAGLALVMPHALLQAYRFAGHYTAGQGLPDLPTLIGALALPIATAAVVTVARRLATTPARDVRAGRPEPTPGAHNPGARSALVGAAVRSIDRVVGWAGTRRGRLALGGGTVALTALVLAYNAARPLLGPDALAPGTNLNAAGDFYARRSLERLAMFLTWPGIALALVGVAVTALRPWRLSRWVAVGPALLLLPLYLQNPRIATRLIWWTRRFLPYNLTGLTILIAVALAAGLVYRGRGALPLRAASAVATVALVGSMLAMSLPLRDHHELAGSLTTIDEVVALDPDGEALFLWSMAEGPAAGSANAFASPVLYRTGAAVTRLPAGATPADVGVWQEALPGRTTFLVADGDALPGPLAGLDAEEVLRVRRSLPLWELTYDERPSRAAALPFHFTVWRLGP
ncbi:MAG TPA: hypothetical protein VMN58_01705 [Acidimicrobiales bacterium]|nr:hypothetical protein [Acidimicrobiales bacterium]